MTQRNKYKRLLCSTQSSTQDEADAFQRRELYRQRCVDPLRWSLADPTTQFRTHTTPQNPTMATITPMPLPTFPMAPTPRMVLNVSMLPIGVDMRIEGCLSTSPLACIIADVSTIGCLLPIIGTHDASVNIRAYYACGNDCESNHVACLRCVFRHYG